MKTSRRWRTLLVVILAGFVLPMGVNAGAAPTTDDDSDPAEIAKAVQDEIAAGGQASFWVVFDSEADLSDSKKRNAMADKARSVRAAKTRHAAKTQAELRRLLDEAGATYESFWISNAILVKDGDDELLGKVAARPEVDSIEPDEPLELPEPQEGTVEDQVNGVEWGVDRINAPQVWDELGVRGEGIVVASIDTGVQFDHPALVNQYRGTNGDGTFSHDYNWFDPANVCPSDEPCDNNNHGTHVTGTMVGDDGAGNQIGVAPGAQWIAAKGCETNQCSDASLLAAGEWILAPTDINGQNPRPDMAPDMVNNSWGGDSGDFWYQDVVEAWVAAGIFPSFANGNSGPACGTAGSPGDYQVSYSSGAFDINNQIANFSSRGPGPGGEIKPNIAAPGVNVRSSVPGGGYAAFNGTSMATPHTTAAVALMWSAAPALRGDVAATRDVLDQSAIDTSDEQCGGTPARNNVWGEGRLDAFAAVEQSPRGDLGAATGKVTDDSGESLAEATLTFDGPVHRVRTTGEDGSYSLNTLQVGDYTVTVEKYGYTTATGTVTVIKDETATADFILQNAPSAALQGAVTDGSGHGWPLYAKISIDGYPGGPIFTDPFTGAYSVELPQNTYTLNVSPVGVSGYQTENLTVEVGASDTRQDIEVQVNPQTCSAPLYAYDYEGPVTDFEGWTDTTPQDGWKNQWLQRAASWRFDDPAGRGNLTGGGGNFAVFDPQGELGQAGGGIAQLTSPVVDLSQVSAPVISFDVYSETGTASSVTPLLNVRLSLNGGQTWSTVRQYGGAFPGAQGHLEIPIPQAAGRTDVQVDFQVISLGAVALEIPPVEIDNVAIGTRVNYTCAPTPGGIVTGFVRDDNTGHPIVDADVRLVADAVSTVETSDAPIAGFYRLYSSGTGAQEVTVTKGRYTAATATVDVTNSSLARQDWSLRAGHLIADRETISVSLQRGESSMATVTITNDGTERVRGLLSTQGPPFNPLSPQYTPQQHVPASPEASMHTLKIVDGRPEFITGTRPAQQPEVSAERPVQPPASTAADGWESLRHTPYAISENAAAHIDGKLYSIGGWRYFPQGGGEPAGNFVKDPDSPGGWLPIADTPQPLMKMGAAVLDGKIYVVGGDLLRDGRDDVLVSTFYVYSPESDTWTRLPDLPHAVQHMGTAVLDDKIYVIGGCTADFFTCPGSKATYRYDPTANQWVRLADYPNPIAGQSCAGVSAQIVCVGGFNSDTYFNDPYKDSVKTHIYHPSSNTWTRGADKPLLGHSGSGNYEGMFTFGANDRLQVAGGWNIIAWHSARVQEYDPVTDTWSYLPNLPKELTLGGSACGIYTVGGRTLPAGQPLGQQTTPVYRLPGYNQCSGTEIPWLAVNKTEIDLAPGESTRVTVTIDASVVAQPGDHQAVLAISTDHTPYHVKPITVTAHVDPPKTWGKIAGTVTDARDGSPIWGAIIKIVPLGGNSGSSYYTLRTDRSGRYEWWLARGPAEVIVSGGFDHEPEVQRAIIPPRRQTAVDFALRTRT